MRETVKSMNGRLARRIAMYVILASTFITIFTSSLQLYSEFQREVGDVNKIFNQIEKTQLQNITSRVWVLDFDELKRTLDNLLSLPAIRYVAIYEGKNVLITVGNDIDKNIITKDYPLIYAQNNKNENIGRLVVKASLDDVYQHIFDRAVIIIASNTVKIFIVALIILFIFFRLVTRHLTSISEFSDSYKFLSGYKSLKLDRTRTKRDELDALVESINDMHIRLNDQILEISEQKQYLALTLNSIGDAVITTDVDGNIIQMNPVAEQLTGWKLQYVIDQPLKSIFSIINASTRESIPNPVEKVLATGETVYLSNHTTLIAKDGTEYQIADSAAAIRDERNNIIGMVLVFNDVTEQYRLREQAKLVQQELQNKEKEQREMLNFMFDSVISIDESGTVLSFNKAAELLFGYSHDEIIGQSVNLLMPGPFAGKHDGYMHRYVKTGAAHIIGLGREVKGQRKNKETFPMRLFVAELPKDADGKQRFIGTCVDLSQIKQQEEQLRRSQKMDALGKLTGGIAHDYNNMLGVVLGYAELLGSMLSDKPELINFVNEITRAGERGVKLTKKLLSFSKQNVSDAEVLNINAVLRDEQDMLEKTLTARINLIFDLMDDLWMTCLDAGELQDALVNMSINAMHAIEGAGEITILTHNETLDQRDATILQLEPGDYVLLSITDTGTGMDEETREKIFEPFYSTKGDRGTGLGLSQVYGFIERSRGAIKVYSEVGLGSRLTIYFPRHLENKDDEDNDGINHTKVNAKEKLAGTETILVVDDETGLRNLTSEMLRQQGYQVFCAKTGKEALELLEQEEIDLLLSDVIMPEMDGYQLSAIVKEKYPSVKIQLASGFSDGRHVKVSDDTLHKNLLHKPYHSEQLLKVIRELLD